MALLPESFLDEVRARAKPSSVVGRYLKLKRRGSGEFVVADDESFTVSDKKGRIHDFGKTGFDGDIFAFVQWQTGGTFLAAVEECASIAGLQLPGGAPAGRGARARAPAKPNGAAESGGRASEAGRGDGGAADAGASFGGSAGRRIVACYDYVDGDGVLRYQEVKFEVVENGKTRKTVQPRRPVEGEPGVWAWGLKAGAYVRGARVRDFYQLTEEREAWSGERREFDEQAPLLYRLPELLAERAEPPDERRTVWCPEGPKDAETLRDFGLLATTCSGGTGGWQPTFGAFFRGLDVIIPIDNDEPGRKFGHAKAAALRAAGAARVRVLDLRDLWGGVTEKADVSDWRDRAGGTREALLAFVDGPKLKDWVPEPPRSQFSAVRWTDLDAPGRELEWLVKGVLTRGEVSVWYGDWGSGKSFLMLDCCCHIARGLSWMGLRTRQGLVVYQAGEGGFGLKKRMRAWRDEHKVERGEDLPLVLLPRTVDLFAGDDDIRRMIEEINGWRAFYTAPLELVVFDTMSSAMPGANENNSADMSRVMKRARAICDGTGAAVAWVHHKPKTGDAPRGWTGIAGNVENMVHVERTEREVDGLNALGAPLKREVRTWTVAKQKDEQDRISREFVLRQVRVGTDLAGDPVTTCIVDALGDAPQRRSEPGRARVYVPPPGYYLFGPGNNFQIFKCLVDLLRERGRAPPANVKCPAMTPAVEIREWQRALERLRRGDEETEAANAEAVRKAISRATKQWIPVLLGRDEGWVWRTEKRVARIDPDPVARTNGAAPEEPMLLAPGESEDDLPF